MDMILMKKRLLLMSVLLAVSFMMVTSVTFAWFVNRETLDFQATAGFVDVELIAYYVDEEGLPITDNEGNIVEAEEVEIEPGVNKPGVYAINIVSSDYDNYFRNFRVAILIHSNVDTYVRIHVIEQLTVTYVNAADVPVELSILKDYDMAFNYNEADWYDRREEDGYIYLMDEGRRISETEALFIPLIDTWPRMTPSEPGERLYGDYPPGYSLQVGFEIDAVQASGGPANNWDIASPPWGGTW